MVKNKKKTLSICVPVFNRISLFERLLKSIKCNEPKLIEVIIIDDGSVDDIKGLIDLYKKKNKKIIYKYFRQKNMGVAHAMISAYKKSNGKYCIKMDTDDIFLKNGINNILRLLKNNKLNFSLNKKICGIIFGTKLIKKNKTIINCLPDKKVTNFLALRADLNNFYDCKEVVEREVILKRQMLIPSVNRVVQQSWLTMANFHDCITSKIIVAQKEYLDDGLSSHSAIVYKVREAKILAKMNVKISESKRYKSKLFKYRSELLAQKYAFHANIRIIKSFRNFFFAILAWPFYHYEKRLYKSIFHNK
jgi:glycosyltransferase involved in cell wall biosynthesis